MRKNKIVRAYNVILYLICTKAYILILKVPHLYTKCELMRTISLITEIEPSLRWFLLFTALKLINCGFAVISSLVPAWLTEAIVDCDIQWILYTLDSPFQSLLPPKLWLCSSNTTAIYLSADSFILCKSFLLSTHIYTLFDMSSCAGVRVI